MRISRTHISRTCLVAALCLGLPLTAQAHRSWMLPSATVLSGDEVWVTVDAAVSNDLFYFEHFPLRIANIGAPPEALGERGGRPGTLMISAPDGSKVEAQNGSIGRYRSTFDVPLKEKGTYKLAVVNDGVFASFKEGGKVRRWRGDAEHSSKEVPPNAEDLRASFLQTRMEVFVTAGKPTTETLKTHGCGTGTRPDHASERSGCGKRRELPHDA